MDVLQRLLLYMCEAFRRLMPKGRRRWAHLQKLTARVRPQLLDEMAILAGILWHTFSNQMHSYYVGVFTRSLNQC